jgi:hypothetical protein
VFLLAESFLIFLAELDAFSSALLSTIPSSSSFVNLKLSHLRSTSKAENILFLRMSSKSRDQKGKSIIQWCLEQGRLKIDEYQALIN